ncbi:MAG: PEGA domain-containing protein [Bacteroidetes bacterium]|nr:PEGA domain-containing protein [Bacteroidota bacterium]
MKKFISTVLLFLPTLLLSQTLREFDLQEMSEQQIPIFVDHPNEAAIVFYTAINGFTVESNKGGVVNTQSEGSKFTAFIRPEYQILTLKAPGFIEKKLVIENLSAKQAKFYRLNPSQSSYAPGKGNFLVTTDPAGCFFTIDGNPDFKVFTPFELNGYEAKKYRIKLTKPDFYDLDTTIEIHEGKSLSGLFKPVPKFGTLSLKAPLAVYIRVNDKIDTIGPEFKSKKLPDGTYVLKVTDPRFDDFEMTVKLNPGEKKVIDLPLVRKIGYIEIDHPEGFDFKIDQVSYQKNPGSQIFELKPGEYTIQLKKPGFELITYSFTITKGEVINWTPTFKRKMVSYSLITVPAGASVIFSPQNGKPITLGFTPLQGQLPVGTGEFLIRKEGVPDNKFIAVLEEDVPYNKTLSLQPPPVEIQKPNQLKSEKARNSFYAGWVNTAFTQKDFSSLEKSDSITRSPVGVGLGFRKWFGSDGNFVVDAQAYMLQSVKTKFKAPVDQLYIGGLSLASGYALSAGQNRLTGLVGYSLTNLGESLFGLKKRETLTTHQVFAGAGVDFTFGQVCLTLEYRHAFLASKSRLFTQIQSSIGWAF